MDTVETAKGPTTDKKDITDNGEITELVEENKKDKERQEELGENKPSG